VAGLLVDSPRIVVARIGAVGVAAARRIAAVAALVVARIGVDPAVGRIDFAPVGRMDRSVPLKTSSFNLERVNLDGV